MPVIDEINEMSATAARDGEPVARPIRRQVETSGWTRFSHRFIKRTPKQSVDDVIGAQLPGVRKEDGE
jgi:hypothetical protein